MFKNVKTDSGKTIALSASNLLASGGEADIYKDGSYALKVYKTPDHPDFVGFPNEAKGADVRISTAQKKLPALLSIASKLPSGDVVPLELLHNGNLVVGYVMNLLNNAEQLRHFSNMKFHNSQVGAKNTILAAFRKLRSSIDLNHKAGLILGDFNPMNVMVEGSMPRVIDIDSAQFGSYMCQVFTAGYVDPLLCDPNVDMNDTSVPHQMLIKPHNEKSDWYAYTVILFASLLCVHPYGGVYCPPSVTSKLSEDARPLKRVSVYNADVRYPKDKIAYHYSILPDDFNQFMLKMIERDERIEFPELLLNMRWTKCSVCGVEHCRTLCPTCNKVAKQAVKLTISVTGTVRCTSVRKFKGEIVYAAIQNGNLLYIYSEGGSIYRETGRKIADMTIDHKTVFGICGNTTLVGRGNKLVEIDESNNRIVKGVDTNAGMPTFAASNDTYYTTENGSVMKSQPIASKFIGMVLPEHTTIYAGKNFGFGYSVAGGIRSAFVFSDGGLIDGIELIPFYGQVLGTKCYFSGDYCWWMISVQENGRVVNRCMVVDKFGKVLARAEGIGNDGAWLSTITGKCANGTSLFSITSDGMVLVKAENNAVSVSSVYPDTKNYVDFDSQLFLSKEGMFVVDADEINLLVIGK
jgi:serine/threonine protein kinase